MGPSYNEACGQQEEALQEEQLQGTLSLDIMLGKMVALVAELNFILYLSLPHLLSAFVYSIIIHGI